LAWELRYERDGFQVAAARKKKRKLPEWYLDEPPEIVGCEFFYDAFRDLATCRAPDGPIPWDKAMRYADRKELASDVADALWTVVRMMDNAERRWRVEQLEEGGG
jgi:hypothetical protein